MRQHSSGVGRDKYDAILFDLDGVVTDTADLHAKCSKQMFDEYLQKRAKQNGETFGPFDLATDYRLYVDGKPRFDGVRDFLSSRGILLPEGKADDPAEAETVSTGNRKNDLINQLIADVGVKPYDGTVQVHPRSSSQRVQNCRSHIELKLYGSAQGLQVGRLLRGAGRWQYD